MAWETVIGLEVHAQLSTQSKIFSGSSIAYGAEPNTQANLVDLGMPGVLPVLNRKAVEMAIRLGLAIDATIAPRSIFARKNYFYPDLPKGYQISQFELPVVAQGHLDITLEKGESKRIGITRAHLEEDAGKSLHEDFDGQSGIDLNRAGTPLLEIVSEPDMRSAKEAVAYLKKLHALVRYLGVCDGNMQEGSFRCDANVSVRRPGEPFGTRAELKNLNSFRFIERAINYEVERQIELLESGGRVVQETRLYDPDRDETRSMRGKEDANDYRYFPDPDLLPLEFDQAYVDALAENLPELPDDKKNRLMSDVGLSAYDASILVSDKAVADYFEAVAAGRDGKQAANWVINNLLGKLNETGQDIEETPVSPDQLGGIIDLIKKGDISGTIAKELFEIVWNEGGDPAAIVEERGMKQVTDTGAIEAAVDEVIAANPDKAEQAREKPNMAGWFVGQVMKATGGKANPQSVQQLVRQKLGIE
ncbi:MAG: Asp-tRNA(Asn)/Glu-tRNA(Gln) amidotransferase subunit GatB [Thiothrix sp.]|nr:Asp-tRNA(Asn)/Glu-tRNA(Gln) amidotransferase subunit GatB [Thiothrix sp.]